MAAIDLKSLMHLLTKWVVEVYHCTKHRKLGMTPLEKWTESIPNRTLELPAYPEQLDVLVGIPAERTLFRYGLEVDNLMYNSEELQDVFRKNGADSKTKIKLKYYEDDVTYIHAFNPSNDSYLRVPAVDWDYATGLNRHVHTLIQAAAREKHGGRTNVRRLLDVKAEIQEIVSKALQSKKMKNRKRGAKLTQHNSEDVLKNANSPIEKARFSKKSAKASPPVSLAAGLDDDLPLFNVSARTKMKQGEGRGQK